jgi:hypothetical protein
MKLSFLSRLLFTWISWAEISTIAGSFIQNEPVCVSDSEELEVCGYSSYIRTRRGSDATAQTRQEENNSRRLDVSNALHCILTRILHVPFYSHLLMLDCSRQHDAF